MTMSSSVSKVTLNGDGVQTSWPFSFKVWKAADLEISITNADGDVSVVSNWTVVLAGQGGTVTYPTTGDPLPSGHKITIRRSMDFLQDVDLVSGTRWDPEIVETALDQATAERQQLKEEVDRALKLDVSDTTSPAALLDSIFEARDTAVDNAASALDSAERAEIAASTVAYYNHEGTLSEGEDTIALPWAYDTSVGVEVFLAGVKQTESSLEFIDTYTVKLDTPVSADTSFEVVASAGATSELGNVLSAAGGSASVGFLQAGTGADGRTVQDKLRDFVSVKDFGATGDGATDDTTAFTTTRDCGAKNIVVPEGTYLVTGATLNVANQTWHIHSGATIKLKDGSNKTLLAIPGAGVIVDGGTFDGNRAGQAGNYVAVTVSGAGSLVRNATITGSGASGVALSGADSVAENVIATDCGIGTSSSAEAGIQLSTAARMKVRNCHTYSNARNGIYLTSCADAEIIGCVTRLNGVVVTDAGSGIRTGGTGTPRAKIIGNTVSDNAESGIYLINGSDESLVHGNTCTGNNTGANPGGHGIEINSSPGTRVTGNTCNENKSGISCNGAHALVVGNECHDNAAYGIKAYGTPDIKIRDNSCSGNTLSGIDANADSGPVAGLEITNNRLNTNGTYGVSVSNDFTNAMILDNTGADNTSGLLGISAITSPTKTISNGDAVWLVARDFQTVGGSPSFDTLRNAAVGVPVWLMDASSAETIEGVVPIWDGTTKVNVELYWANGGAGTGNVVWGTGLYSLTDGSSVVTTGTGTDVTDTAGAQYVVVTTTLKTGVAVSDGLLKIRLVRQAANAADTLANDAAVIAVKVSKA